MNEIDYEKEYKKLLSELIAEKQKQICNMQHEIQDQETIINIQLQNAMIQANIKHTIGEL